MKKQAMILLYFRYIFSTQRDLGHMLKILNKNKLMMRNLIIEENLISERNLRKQMIGQRSFQMCVKKEQIVYHFSYNFYKF